MIAAVNARSIGWTGSLIVALLVPVFVGTPYYLSTGIFALMYVALAVAFDLVVGRIGALSLAQPVFYGYGAYAAALLATHPRPGPGFWVEALAATIGASILALAIGIPAFRLSLHSFAMGTLGFALIAQLVANNWLSVTRGPLCISAIAPLRLSYPGGGLLVTTNQEAYYVILTIAVMAILLVWLVSRSRLGMAFRAVRDDPVLAAARGLSPMQMRLLALTVSAVLSALVGVFAAHFETVVCPSSIDLSITVLLLIIVFVGGRGSLRGVVTAAVIFTVVPELLRIAASMRLVIFGAVLLVTVAAFPDGFEHLYARTGRLISQAHARARLASSEAAGKA